MSYTVIRTDLMSGTKQPADLVSVRFYDGDDNMAAVENGTIVKLLGYESGSREIIKAEVATATCTLDNCAVIAGVEVPYDERLKNLEDFINEKGRATRGYLLRDRNLFSITADGFVGTPPAKDAAVGIGAGGKLDATKTGFGVCEEIEVAGRHKFYLIRIKYPAIVAAAEDDTDSQSN